MDMKQITGVMKCESTDCGKEFKWCFITSNDINVVERIPRPPEDGTVFADSHASKKPDYYWLSCHCPHCDYETFFYHKK